MTLGYSWTMSNPIGVFGAIQPDGGVGTPGQDEAAGPSDPMQFMCTSPGTTTITVLVDTADPLFPTVRSSVHREHGLDDGHVRRLSE